MQVAVDRVIRSLIAKLPFSLREDDAVPNLKTTSLHSVTARRDERHAAALAIELLGNYKAHVSARSAKAL